MEASEALVNEMSKRVGITEAKTEALEKTNKGRNDLQLTSVKISSVKSVLMSGFDSFSRCSFQTDCS